MQLSEIVQYLDSEYPAATAEEWDNVGLLVGDVEKDVQRIATCLTVTPNVCQEAVEEKVDLVVSHHPFPFRSLRRITSRDVEGKMLLTLIGSGVAVYSPHTAHDSAPDGVNHQLASILKLTNVEALYENGSGRIGCICNDSSHSGRKLVDFLEIVQKQLGPCSFVGDRDKEIRRVAIGCGAADDFVDEAARQNADLLLLGEARFHACLKAESLGLALILPGHYASERFAVETLAEKIARKFSDIACFASRTEHDVLQRF